MLQVVRAGGAHTVPDIAAASGLPQPAVDRWVRRLAGWNLLTGTENGFYRAGLALRLTGDESLSELAETPHGAVRIGVLHRSGIGYIERTTGSASVTAAGSRRADTGALGHALLAFDADRDTDSTVHQQRLAGHRSSEKLHRALALTRLSGVAITRRRARGKGFRIAVPVLDSAGFAVVAIERTIPDLDDSFPPVLAALQSASHRLSQDPALQAGGADDPAQAGGDG
jgi:DNA-binding IclR family transcriptional regulator